VLDKLNIREAVLLNAVTSLDWPSIINRNHDVSFMGLMNFRGTNTKLLSNESNTVILLSAVTEETAGRV
jgi:hypothetical protein